MRKILYCGGFPPPYGGVTVKNSLLTAELEARGCRILRLDTRKAKRNPLHLVNQTARLLLARKEQVIVANSRAGRRQLTMLLAKCNPAALRDALLIVMGGSMAKDIAEDEAYIAALKQYRQIFVETPSMEQELRQLGFTNLSLYPNCRPDLRVKAIRPTGQRLSCLFFSLVSPDKGVDLILEAAQKLPDIQFTFYGPVEQGYEEVFQKSVSALPNCSWQGVFPGNDPSLYPLLNGYDLLLLPTLCATEGVPGILAESKLAALPSVVTDIARNRELIYHDDNGIVLSENTAQCLTQVLAELAERADYVDTLKASALRDAERFLVQNHIETIMRHLLP